MDVYGEMYQFSSWLEEFNRLCEQAEEFHMANDTIQLMEDAVVHRLPPYADEEDMYEALDNCALTEVQIYAEVDRRTKDLRDTLPQEQLAHLVREILFEAFDDALATATAHKAPLYG